MATHVSMSGHGDMITDPKHIGFHWPMDGVVLAVATEIMPRVDATGVLIREDEFEPNFGRGIRGLLLFHDPLNGIAFPGPGIMVPADQVEPFETADKPIHQLPRLARTRGLLAPQMGEATNPVVRTVSDVGAKKPFRFVDQVDMLFHEPEIRAIIIQVRIAKVPDANWSINVDLDGNQLPCIFIGLLPRELLLAMCDQFFDAQVWFGQWGIGKRFGMTNGRLARIERDWNIEARRPSQPGLERGRRNASGPRCFLGVTAMSLIEINGCLDLLVKPWVGRHMFNNVKSRMVAIVNRASVG